MKNKTGIMILIFILVMFLFSGAGTVPDTQSAGNGESVTGYWHVIYCGTGDKERDNRLNTHLYFAVLDRETTDLLLFGVKSGSVYPSESEDGENLHEIKLTLSKGDTDIWKGSGGRGFTGKAVILDMGDVLNSSDSDEYGEYCISEIQALVH